MKIELNYTLTEAARLFREAGIICDIRPVEVEFKTFNDRTYTDIIETWAVENPHNGKVEQLEGYFRKYMEMKKRELFLSEENKLKILTLFDK